MLVLRGIFFRVELPFKDDVSENSVRCLCSVVELTVDNVFVSTGSAANWRQVTSSSQLRDVEWTTHSCTLSFTVCGQSWLFIFVSL